MERGSGRGRGRGRGSRARGTKRGRKPKVVVLEEETNEVVEAAKVEVKDLEPLPIAAVTPTLEEIEMQIDVKEIDMKADISKLEAPTFTTIQRNIPQLMLRLNWDHKVNLIGEKVLNPMIHCCDQCEKPILIYGRMIPCKHVFCLKCARTEILKTCPRCKDKVIRVEQTGLGTVFMCTHGGGRYESTGCRRTYLSQRDLQAHINHRHVSLPAVVESKSDKLQQQSSSLQANSHPRKDSLTSSSQSQATHSVKHDNQQQHLVGGNMQSQMNNMMSSHPSHTGANNKITHDMHAFRNLNYGSSGQFNNSNQQQQNQPLSGSYPPYSSQSFNNMGHYSQQQQPPSTQQHQNWNQNQNQQYFR